MPRTADADVEDANILLPFSNSIEPLFHAMILAVTIQASFRKQVVTYREVLCSRALFASIPILTLSLNIA